MDLYIVSASKNPDINKPYLDQVAEALEYQLYQHVAPFWQISGVRVTALSSIEGLPKHAGASPLVIYDSAEQAGFFGWHAFNSQEGQIHGTTFVDPILNSGGSLLKGPNAVSVTLSHEVIEAVLDPYVNSMAFVDDNTLEPLEACDRVQGDTYEINGVSVSNFLGPRAFRHGPGPYDWLRKLQSPWDMTPGGYCMRLDLRSRSWNTLWGQTVPGWKRELVAEKLDKKLSRLSHYVNRQG